MKRAILSMLLWFAFSGTVNAQNATIQQPILGTTSVGTSVVVPDRGRVFLGGSTSAQSSRVRAGFLPFGSSVGASRSSNSLSVGVTIIDLREMDEAILNSVPHRTTSSSSFARQTAVIRHSGTEISRTATFVEETSPLDRAAKFEQLALKAEDEHRLGVARLHWQMAAKYGSTLARERLVASSR